MSEKPVSFEIRRFEIMEERLIQAERELSTIDNELSFVRAELSRRVDAVDKTSDEHIERIRIDLRERIDALRIEIKDIKEAISSDLDQLNNNIIAVNDSVQQLYIAQSGTKVKVGVNEKIIWGIVTAVGVIALYYIQELIKVGAV